MSVEKEELIKNTEIKNKVVVALNKAVNNVLSYNRSINNSAATVEGLFKSSTLALEQEEADLESINNTMNSTNGILDTISMLK